MLSACNKIYVKIIVYKQYLNIFVIPFLKYPKWTLKPKWWESWISLLKGLYPQGSPTVRRVTHFHIPYTSIWFPQ